MRITSIVICSYVVNYELYTCIVILRRLHDVYYIRVMIVLFVTTRIIIYFVIIVTNLIGTVWRVGTTSR